MRLHPKPLTAKTKLLPSHFAGIDRDNDEHRALSERVGRYARIHPGGWSTNRELLTKVSAGVSHSSAGLKWAEFGKTPGTIIKLEVCDCGIVHPNRQRYLSMNELKVLGGFPQSFRFKDRRDAVNRIGNSVPPPITKAIGDHLKTVLPLKTFVSLFAGCGGSSLGYKLAGLSELFAVEYDKSAANTFALNFPGIKLIREDVRTIDRVFLSDYVGRIDLLDGSPPCQGFSTAGLRRVGDDRNELYMEMVRFAKILKPKAIVVENVSTMAKGKMAGHFLGLREGLEGLGYYCQAQILDCSYYDLPQSRKRLFLIGYRAS